MISWQPDTRPHRPTLRGYRITIALAFIAAAIASALTGLLQ
jgi:hypothetical protein